MSNIKKVDNEHQTKSSEDDLYKILPRFVSQKVEYIKGLLLKPIQREFEWKGETCQLIIKPGFIEDEDGQHRNYFPGRQEQQVEAALIEFVRHNKNAFFDEKKAVTFTLRQLEKHFIIGNDLLSQKQIKRSIHILASTDFTICTGDRRWMFKLIDTLAIFKEGSEARFIVYLGALIAKEIKKI